MTQTSNSRRIAKNTLLLYFRLIITIFVSLYASRIVLNVLGIVDYGIFNVVGGVVAMLAFINVSMANAIQRFISFEIGVNNIERIKNVFKVSLTIQLLLVIIIVVVAETLGLWFLNHKMVIPENRMFAANCVYQLSVLSFVFVILQAPFNAIIIAYEKMSFYAYISIIEAFLKLIIVFLISMSIYDKLIVYSFLLTVVTLIVFVIYLIFVKYKFKTVEIQFGKNRELFLSMSSFMGWNILGSLSYTMKNQGINVLLNLFFGAVINAARGLSYQIFSAINGFIANFQIAFRPQMIKSYSQGDIEYVKKMLYSVTKFSFFLIYLFSLPVLIETDFILKLWLGDNVPKYTSLFTKIIILTGIIDAFATPISIIVHATGKVKWFQIITSCIMLAIIPIAYLFLKNGFPPQTALIISLIITLVVQIIRLLILKRLIVFSLWTYSRKVVFPTLFVFIGAYIPPLIFCSLLKNSFSSFVFISFICIISIAFFTYLFGLNKEEKTILLDKLNILYKKIKNK